MKKEKNKKKKINSKGFTLVEVLAAVAIVAILGTVATPLVTRTIQTSKGKSYYVTAKSFKKAASNICYEGSELNANNLSEDVSYSDIDLAVYPVDTKKAEISLWPTNSSKFKNMILSNYDESTYTYDKDSGKISFTVNCKGTLSYKEAPVENNVATSEETKEDTKEKNLLDILYAITKVMDNNAKTICKNNNKISSSDFTTYIGKGLENDIGIMVNNGGGSGSSILERKSTNSLDPITTDENNGNARILVYAKEKGTFDSLRGIEKVDEKKYPDYKWSIFKLTKLNLLQRKQMAPKKSDSITDNTIDNDDNLFDNDSNLKKFYGFEITADCVANNDSNLSQANQEAQNVLQ